MMSYSWGTWAGEPAKGKEMMIDTVTTQHPVDGLKVGDALVDDMLFAGEVIAVDPDTITVKWDDWPVASPYKRQGLKELWNDGEVSIKEQGER